MLKAPSASVVVCDAIDFLSALEPGSVDLFVSSPPYFMGKAYDTSLKVKDFATIHRRLAPLLWKALKPSGSLCWQVGTHVRNGVSTPLDFLTHEAFSSSQTNFQLRNRIIWTFGHGTHAAHRFSGRYETIMWYSKTDKYFFELDSVRIPQKYPGKRHYKGTRKGDFSGNPLGKNPSDVWDIPNVKANHIEKTDHPCQFPVALIQRLIRALTPEGGLIVDCFAGAASAGVAAIVEGRSFLGCDVDPIYVAIGTERLAASLRNELKYRSIDAPIFTPSEGLAVAKAPAHFAHLRSVFKNDAEGSTS